MSSRPEDALSPGEAPPKKKLALQNTAASAEGVSKTIRAAIAGPPLRDRDQVSHQTSVDKVPVARPGGNYALASAGPARSIQHSKKVKGPRPCNHPPPKNPTPPKSPPQPKQQDTGSWVESSKDAFDKTSGQLLKRGRASGGDSLAEVPGAKKAKTNHSKQALLQLDLLEKTGGNQSQKGALGALEKNSKISLREHSKTYQRDGPDSRPVSRNPNSAAAAGSNSHGSNRRPGAAKHSTSRTEPIDLTMASEDDDDDNKIYFAGGTQAEKSATTVPTQSFDVLEVFVGRRLFIGGDQKLVLSGSGERAIEIVLHDDFRSSGGSSGSSSSISSSFATSAGDECGTLHDSSEVNPKNWPLFPLSEVLPLSSLETVFVGTAHKGAKPYVALKLNNSRAKLVHTTMEGAAFRESPSGQKVVLLMLKCEASGRDEMKVFTDRVRLALKRVANITLGTPRSETFLDRTYSKKAAPPPTELELLDAFKNDEKIMKRENPTHERRRYYGRIATESSEELTRQLADEKRKAERSSRRQRQAAVTPIGHREGDNLTYLVYPVEEEVLDCVTITNGDIRRLESPQWLNDSLIDLCVRVAVHGVVLPSEHSSATSGTDTAAATATVAATATATATAATPAAAAGEGMEVDERGGVGEGAIPAEGSAQAVLSAASARAAGGGTQMNSIHAFNSLFLTKLREKTTKTELSSSQALISKIEKETGVGLSNDEKHFYNFAARHKRVARWTKNVSVLEKKLLLVPINQNLHWSLAVVVRPDLLLQLAEENDDVAPASASVSGRGQSVPAAENSLSASDRETQDETQDDNDDGGNDHANIVSKHTSTSSEQTQLNLVGRCVFFHLDSMNVHNTIMIHQSIVLYMLHEFLHKHCDGNTLDPRFRRLYAHLNREHNSTVSLGNRRKAAEKPNGFASLVPILDFKAITPQQENGIDCGVFVVKFAKQVADNRERLCNLSPNASAISHIRAVLDEILRTDEFSQEEIDEKRVDILKMLKGVVKPAFDKRKEFEKLRRREEKALAKSAAAAAAAAAVASGEGADTEAPGVSSEAGTGVEGAGSAPASPIGGNSSGIEKSSSKSSTGGDDDDDDDIDDGNDPEIVHGGAASANSTPSLSPGGKEDGADKSENESENENESESESESDEDKTQEQDAGWSTGAGSGGRASP